MGDVRRGEPGRDGPEARHIPGQLAQDHQETGNPASDPGRARGLRMRSRRGRAQEEVLAEIPRGESILSQKSCRELFPRRTANVPAGAPGCSLCPALEECGHVAVLLQWAGELSGECKEVHDEEVKKRSEFSGKIRELPLFKSVLLRSSRRFLWSCVQDQ